MSTKKEKLEFKFKKTSNEFFSQRRQTRQWRMLHKRMYQLSIGISTVLSLNDRTAILSTIAVGIDKGSVRFDVVQDRFFSLHPRLIIKWPVIQIWAGMSILSILFVWCMSWLTLKHVDMSLVSIKDFIAIGSLMYGATCVLTRTEIVSGAAEVFKST